MKYTNLGFGDATPDYKEDDRPQCEYCNNHHDNQGDYCCAICYDLDQPTQVIYEKAKTEETVFSQENWMPSQRASNASNSELEKVAMNQTIRQQKSFRDLKHCTAQKHKREVCLGGVVDTRSYPAWIEWLFWGGVTAVFVVAVVGFFMWGGS